MSEPTLEIIEENNQNQTRANDHLAGSNLDSIADCAQIAKSQSDAALGDAHLAKNFAESSATSAQEAKASADAAAASAQIAKENADTSISSAKAVESHLNSVVNSVSSIENNLASLSSSVQQAKDSSNDAMGSAQLANMNADSSASNAKIVQNNLDIIINHVKTAQDNAESAISSAKQAESCCINIAVSATKVEEELSKAKLASERARQEADMAAQAHNMSTTVGLAGAFNKKAVAANRSLKLWSFFLGIVLLIITVIGYLKINSILKLIESLIGKNELLATIGVEIIFMVSSVAPLVWGAWICTKMISKYFHLAEDYSYKAAISQAYVGFKEQTNNLDPIFQERLFAAAITQLDANPLRLFESSALPGSPLQDLLQQPFFQAALQDDSFKESLTGWFKKVFKSKFNLPKSRIPKIVDNE